MMMKTAPQTIDEYIESFPADVQTLLQEVRSTIKCAAPEAEECISYQMPAFRLNGILLYFAGYKKHIGFYPTGSGIAAFKDEISGYKNSKGAVQFPIDKPMPLDLIRRITEFRLSENTLKKRKV